MGFVGSAMEGRSRRRALSNEEIELWAHVTRRDTPLARRRAASRAASAAAAPSDAEPAATPPLAKAAEPPSPKPALSAKTRPASPEPEPFDPRIGKRIARGRHEIDARLDLHGMRQHDAYAALRGFLARCQAQGHRHVLIITGKGGNSEDARPGFLAVAGARRPTQAGAALVIRAVASRACRQLHGIRPQAWWQRRALRDDSQGPSAKARRRPLTPVPASGSPRQPFALAGRPIIFCRSPRAL